MLVLSGLEHDNGNALGDGPGDHARAGAVFLTGVHSAKTAGADIKNGVSVDQIAARQLGVADAARRRSSWAARTRASSATATPATAAPTPTACRGAARRRRCRRRPTRARCSSACSAPTPGSIRRRAAQRLRTRRSILDLVGERSAALRNDLGAQRSAQAGRVPHRGPRDRAAHPGQAETRQPRVRCRTIEKPSGIPTTFAEHVALMFDLQALAFQADLTRVATMMIAREGSTRTYPEIGVPDPHHPLTHHRNNTEWIEKVTQINEFHMELFAQLHREADGDAGRRRHAARSLDDRLRQRHRRRQPAHAPRPAGAAGRQRRRRARAGAAHPLRARTRR